MSCNVHYTISHACRHRAPTQNIIQDILPSRHKSTQFRRRNLLISPIRWLKLGLSDDQFCARFCRTPSSSCATVMTTDLASDARIWSEYILLSSVVHPCYIEMVEDPPGGLCWEELSRFPLNSD